MAQNQIAITTGVSTHEDVLGGMNLNFADSETRLGSLELESTQQTISSSGGILTLDIASGHSAGTTLTEDVSGFVFNNTNSGDSGLVIVKQDNTAGWTFSVTQDVLVGDLADVVSITPSGSGAATIGWYDDGTDEYLYVSSFT